MSLLIGAGNSNMPQPGTSFSELPIVKHHQLTEFIATNDTITNNNNNNNRNSNLKFHDSNGEVITMLTNHVSDSSDMSLRNFRPDHIDDDMDTQVDYTSDYLFSHTLFRFYHNISHDS